MPNEFTLLLLSMMPVTELRGSIPIGIFTLGMPPFEVLPIAILGNMIPVPVIIVFVRHVFELMRHLKFFGRIISSLERRAQSKAAQIHKYEKLGLLILVAIPLPGTGAWTGALVAAFLGMRLKVALPIILTGVIIAGLIVTSIALWFH